MFTPKISIIIPVYNLENYIENTIHSLRAQTYKNIEIIIVDDGSKDTSLSIIEKLAETDSRIVYTTQPNGGAAKARNTGLALATGEFITFVDGDDMLSPNALTDNIGYFVDDKIDWVAFSIRRVNSKGEYIQRNGIYSDFIISACEEISADSFVPYFYSHKLSGVACAAIYRKSSINKISFTEGKFYEDSIFFIDLLCNTKKAILSNTGEYLYVDRENSSQKAILDYKHLESSYYVTNKRLTLYAEKYPLYDSFYRKNESDFYYLLKNESAKGNDAAKSFMKEYIKSLKYPLKRNYRMELKCFIYRTFGYNTIKKIVNLWK